MFAPCAAPKAHLSPTKATILDSPCLGPVRPHRHSSPQARPQRDVLSSSSATTHSIIRAEVFIRTPTHTYHGFTDYNAAFSLLFIFGTLFNYSRAAR